MTASRSSSDRGGTTRYTKCAAFPLPVKRIFKLAYAAPAVGSWNPLPACVT